MLKLLARNVEANRHLFAVERSLTNANDNDIGARAHTGRNGDCATTSDTSCGNGDGGSHEGAGHCVAAVRELDWFTFSREEGPTDAAICDPVGEGSQVL